MRCRARRALLPTRLALDHEARARVALWEKEHHRSARSGVELAESALPHAPAVDLELPRSELETAALDGTRSE